MTGEGNFSPKADIMLQKLYGKNAAKFRYNIALQEFVIIRSWSFDNILKH